MLYALRQCLPYNQLHGYQPRNHSYEYFLLHRIRRLRIEPLLQEHRNAHDDGPDADIDDLQALRHVPLEQTEADQQAIGVGRRQILNPAEERRMAHLDRDE